MFRFVLRVFGVLAILGHVSACDAVKLGRESGEETGKVDSNSARESSSDTSSDSVTDSSGEENCAGVVEALGVVEYPRGTRVYDLAATSSAVYVARPEDGEAGTGVVDGWAVDRFVGLLDAELDAPDSVVTGRGSGEYLGVSLWRDVDEDVLYSQEYGDENKGRLVGWAAGDSGATSEVAVVALEGETESGFFGYGFDAEGDGVYAFDASPPGRTVRVTSDGAVEEMAVSACGEGWDFCQDGALLSDVFITTSDFGAIFAADASTGEELWRDETAVMWSPTNLNGWGTRAVMFGSPQASDGKMSRVYNASGVLELSDVFISGVTWGPDEGGKNFIAYHSWVDNDDGSTGGLSIFTERTGVLRAATTYPDLIGDIVGIEDPSSWAEPYIIVEALGRDGLLAFAVRGGRYVGLLRVCAE